MAEKSIIRELGSTIETLMAGHQRLAQLNSELRSQREALLVQRRDLQQQVSTLESELSKLRLTEALGGKGTDKERARARVNQLMREVDRCVALLNKVDKEE